MVLFIADMQLLKKNLWFMVLDLKDAYFCISICTHNNRYLCFCYGDKMYQYNVLLLDQPQPLEFS